MTWHKIEWWLMNHDCVFWYLYTMYWKDKVCWNSDFSPPSILVSYSYANILIMMSLLFSLQPIYKVLAISLKAYWLLQQWESDLSNSRKFEKIANVYKANGLKVLFVITYTTLLKSIYVLQLVLLWISISDYYSRQFFEACIWGACRAFGIIWLIRFNFQP